MHGQTQQGPIWELVWDILGKLLGPIWVPREIPLGSQWNPIIIPQVGPRWVAHKGPIIVPIWPPVGSHMCVLTGLLPPRVLGFKYARLDPLHRDFSDASPLGCALARSKGRGVSRSF